ncbi:MAG: DUF2075 domain-containing protein [Cyclobacteriaceae bacterium]
MRCFYENSIAGFISESLSEIIGKIVLNSGFADETTQKRAWEVEIELLKDSLSSIQAGNIYFEFSVPRMGSRIDVVLSINGILFVIEFKVGAKDFLSSYYDQVFDYALDLKNFHESSHDLVIAPVVVSTEAEDQVIALQMTPHKDKVFYPVHISGQQVSELIQLMLKDNKPSNHLENWSKGRYAPTPTIIEAAKSLYNKHSVEEISRRDASAKNLRETSKKIEEIIEHAKSNNEKAICFVTGVPGAGKTLVGLNIATQHSRKDNQASSVFLSGNGPLVAILREALTRDRVKREKEKGNKIKKGQVMSQVKSFIQNVHHYRDEYLLDERAPYDHVAIFDEAQRAWNLEQTKAFMKSKKNKPDFNFSEPEFLISCLDRHKDWAVIVCLVGGGQEINTGEAGISEWIESLNRSYPDWSIYISDRLTDKEYAAGKSLEMLAAHKSVDLSTSLHLSVSLRSFRAERLSDFVKCVLDLEADQAKDQYQYFKDRYPLLLTRDLQKAKYWLKEQARGSERYGMIVSSQAERLKPYAIDVKSPIKPIHWFLNDKKDVRSSYYMESVATEFHVQGLELDWTCVCWDGDLRFVNDTWKGHSFRGDKWQNINKQSRQKYLLNAYRVLLTRARQGMIIFIPKGNQTDHTRLPSFYDGTYEYLLKCGIKEI